MADENSACAEIRMKLRQAVATWEHQRASKTHPGDLARTRREIVRLKRRLHDLCGK